MTDDELNHLEGTRDMDYGPSIRKLVAEVRRLRGDYSRGFAAALEAAAKTVRKYLAHNDQRAVSWHEVEDCAVAIKALAPSAPSAVTELASDSKVSKPSPTVPVTCATCGGGGFVGVVRPEGYMGADRCPDCRRAR